MSDIIAMFCILITEGIDIVCTRMGLLPVILKCDDGGIYIYYANWGRTVPYVDMCPLSLRLKRIPTATTMCMIMLLFVVDLNNVISTWLTISPTPATALQGTLKFATPAKVNTHQFYKRPTNPYSYRTYMVT